MSVKIGALEIGKTPRVVGVVSAALTLDRLASGFRPICDIVELRADLLGAGLPEWLERAVDLERAGLPVLITLRHSREGGHWYGAELERLRILEKILPYVSAIDFETRSESFPEAVKLAHSAGKTLVASFHDFQGMPADQELRAIIERGTQAGADIVKIAAMTHSNEELIRMESFLASHRGPPLCLLGMGARGPESRVRLAQRGSCLTYGFVDEANVSGQLSSEELVRILACGRM